MRAIYVPVTEPSSSPMQPAFRQLKAKTRTHLLGRQGARLLEVSHGKRTMPDASSV